MGASFRNIDEILELAGCDFLTISPALMDELRSIESDLPRKLNPETAQHTSIEKKAMDKSTFKKIHSENKMAEEKLAEGIDGFSKALVSLEHLLAERLKNIETG